MNLCSDGHDEVCYEVRNCPVCEIIRDISNLEDEIFELNKLKIQNLINNNLIEKLNEEE